MHHHQSQGDSGCHGIVQGMVKWTGLDALQDQVIPLAVGSVWQGSDGQVGQCCWGLKCHDGSNDVGCYHEISRYSGWRHMWWSRWLHLQHQNKVHELLLQCQLLLHKVCKQR
eukprot:13976977-Ditylum_brightwellii.AAC.2